MCPAHKLTNPHHRGARRLRMSERRRITRLKPAASKRDWRNRSRAERELVDEWHRRQMGWRRKRGIVVTPSNAEAEAEEPEQPPNVVGAGGPRRRWGRWKSCCSTRTCGECGETPGRCWVRGPGALGSRIHQRTLLNLWVWGLGLVPLAGIAVGLGCWWHCAPKATLPVLSIGYH